MRIALVGAGGFVGSALDAELRRATDADVVAVTRADYEVARDDGPYDVLINAAMPSKRFWAKQYPALDFDATVGKTSGLLNDWHWEKFIQISSISARSQLDTIYGRHKAAAEKLCEYGRNLIVRLGPMYGDRLEKGVLIDILHGRTVFIDRSSQYCFADVDWVARWITRNLSADGVVEVGARDAISVGEVAEAVASSSEFEGPVDHQVTLEPIEDAPRADAAIAFVEARRTAAGDVR